MMKMGFSDRRISWVMECVRSVSYSIIVNSQPVGQIKLMRGLRQGDPISPYLFLICVEVLSFMLIQAESRGVISGVPTIAFDICFLPTTAFFFARLIRWNEDDSQKYWISMKRCRGKN